MEMTVVKIDIIPIVHNRCTVRVKYLKLHTAYSTVQTHYAHIMEKLNL
jgi:hypothetical protein